MGSGQSFPAVDYAETPHITSATGRRLYTRSWKPEGEIRALVYLCHGVSEHIERYGHLAESFSSIGMAVFGHDHVGHGRSEGDPVYVKDTAEYVADLVQRIEQVRAEHAGLRLFLLGHSMGGLLAFLTAARRTDIVDYLILSAPAIVADPETATPFKVYMARKLAGVAPQVSLGKLPREYVCRDQAVLDALTDDPYVYHGGMKAGWGVAMLDAQEDAQTRFETFTTPLLVYHGTGDRVCRIEGSRALYNGVKSRDKTMKEFEGGYHEVEREPDGMGEAVLKMVTDWTNERISNPDKYAQATPPAANQEDSSEPQVPAESDEASSEPQAPPAAAPEASTEPQAAAEPDEATSEAQAPPDAATEAAAAAAEPQGPPADVASEASSEPRD